MPNGWSAKDVSQVVPVSGIVTNQPVSKEFPITAGGSRFLVVKCVATGVTQVGTLTLKFQHAIGSDWVDGKTASITADGITYFRYNNEVAADQASIPLLNKGRIVITTTNAGDAITISEVSVLQDL